MSSNYRLKNTKKTGLSSWYSTGAAQTSSIGFTWELVRAAESQDLSPDLLNQNLHYYNIPRWFISTLKFEKLWPRWMLSSFQLRDCGNLGNNDRARYDVSTCNINCLILYLCCHSSKILDDFPPSSIAMLPRETCYFLENSCYSALSYRQIVSTQNCNS